VVDDEVSAERLAEVLGAAAGDLLESVTLFDVYRGEGIPVGRRSLAYRLRFCSSDHTLTDAEVGALRVTCIEAAVEGFGAVLR
jgi:phenylalanyl-tRNA synthetase beta chain